MRHFNIKSITAVVVVMTASFSNKFCAIALPMPSESFQLPTLSLECQDRVMLIERNIEDIRLHWLYSQYEYNNLPVNENSVVTYHQNQVYDKETHERFLTYLRILDTRYMDNHEGNGWTLSNHAGWENHLKAIYTECSPSIDYLYDIFGYLREEYPNKFEAVVVEIKTSLKSYSKKQYDNSKFHFGKGLDALFGIDAVLGFFLVAEIAVPVGEAGAAIEVAADDAVSDASSDADSYYMDNDDFDYDNTNKNFAFQVGDFSEEGTYKGSDFFDTTDFDRPDFQFDDFIDNSMDDSIDDLIL